jgi:hypothetical protein
MSKEIRPSDLENFLYKNKKAVMSSVNFNTDKSLSEIDNLCNSIAEEVVDDYKTYGNNDLSYISNAIMENIDSQLIYEEDSYKIVFTYRFAFGTYDTFKSADDISDVSEHNLDSVIRSIAFNILYSKCEEKVNKLLNLKK